LTDLHFDLLYEALRNLISATSCLYQFLDGHVETVGFKTWHAQIHVTPEILLLLCAGFSINNQLEHFHAVGFFTVSKNEGIGEWCHRLNIFVTH
jgi:hypothetical protein